MDLRTRVDMFSYMLSNDIVELLLRLAGRDVRSEIAGSASGSPAVIIDELTGIGAMLPRYAKRFPEARIIAIDLDAGMLECLQKHTERAGPEGVEFLPADARELPLAAGSADLVNISYGLHELNWLDRELVLGEACRILKPGGELVVADYRAGRGLVRRALTSIYFRLAEPRWIREIFDGGLQRQVEDAGFEIRRVTADLPVTQLVVARKAGNAPCARRHMRLVT